MGDGNNVCHSLLYASAIVGLNMNVACPSGYAPDKSVLKQSQDLAKTKNVRIQICPNPKQAVKDVWASMGQEKETHKRKKIFKEFQVNAELAKLARENALIMHCLPAHRQEEITDVRRYEDLPENALATR